MNKQHLCPKALFDSSPFGFSQIVMTDPGKLVFLSGQVAWDENRNLVGKGDLQKQTQKAFENVKTAIEHVGGSLDKIVMLRLYIVNYTSEKGTIISEALNSFFDWEALPASTWISVNGLASKDFLIEVEAQAVI